MLKKFFISIVLLAVIGAGALGWTYNQVKESWQQLSLNQESTIVTVKPGTSFNSMLASLVEQGIVAPTQWDRFVARLKPELTHLKVGTYQLAPQMTREALFTHLVSGKEHQFAITLIEGGRFTDWRSQLSNAPHVTHQADELSEADIAKQIGADVEKLEGMLLPETYYYTAGTSDIALFKRAYQQMQSVVEQAWQQRDKDLPLSTPYEALIMASIIEKETAVDAERTKVSSVFTNRLRKGMRLQTDPTVIYGMGDEYDGDIRRKDLRTPTPYNTYVINGLPPTPIAMPSKASVLAAVQPQETSYYYFVADGTGGHKFSKSLREHNRAVRAYLRTLKQQK